MDVYVYKAALICTDCAEEILPGLQPDEDSDRYPQGPHADGGGEADCPEHCDLCGVFLENPLTPDGVEYVRNSKGSDSDEWCKYYGLESYQEVYDRLHSDAFDIVQSVIDPDIHEYGQYDQREMGKAINDQLYSAWHDGFTSAEQWAAAVLESQ